MFLQIQVLTCMQMSLHYTVTDGFAHSKFCHTFFYTQMFGMQMFLHRTIFTNIYFFQHNRFLHADALMGIFVFGKQKSIHTNVLHPGAFTDGLVLHGFACRKLGHPDVRAHTCFNTKKSTQNFLHIDVCFYTLFRTKKTKGVFTLKCFCFTHEQFT